VTALSHLHGLGGSTPQVEYEHVLVGRRRAKEGVEVYEDLCREFGSAGSMVDRHPGFVAHDERIGCESFGPVGTAFREARNPRPQALFVIDDEHDFFLFLTSLHLREPQVLCEKVYQPCPILWLAQRLVFLQPTSANMCTPGLEQVCRMHHTPDGLWRFRNPGETEDSLAIIEVEISAKNKDQLERIMRDLAVYAPVIWYFVDMDPAEGVYTGLMEVLEEIDERRRGRFLFFDLADPAKLVYRYGRT
jgi:hypothetical protein